MVFRWPSSARASVAYPLLLSTATRRPSGSGGATSRRSPPAGFEVIAPDLRGVGDSDLPPDDVHDIAAYARDLHALVHDVLGHTTCVVAGERRRRRRRRRPDPPLPGTSSSGFCVFNTVPPMGVDVRGRHRLRTAASGPSEPTRPATTARMQGAFPDELAAMLAHRAARRQWVAGDVHEPAVGSPGTFDQADVDFMTEPFADEARLRAGWASYQLAYGRPMAEPPLMDAVDVRRCCSTAPTITSSVRTSCRAASVRSRDRIGPLVVPGAGHFLQWERADIFNELLPAVFGDVMRGRHV